MLRSGLVVVVLAALLAAPAAAQGQSSHAIEFAGGYSFARITEERGLNLPPGWVATVAVPFSGLFSVVGEFSGNYRTEYGETLQMHFIQGGLKVSAPVKGNRVRPYAQFLAGGVYWGCCGGGAMDPAIEVGGGVDVPIGPAALRFGITFPMVFTEEEVGNLMRFQTGIAFPVGKR